MTFQILFFLMISFKPTQVEEGQVDLNLPGAQSAAPTEPAVTDPSPVDLPTRLTVEIQSTPAGSWGRIIVKSVDGGHFDVAADAVQLETFLKDQRGPDGQGNIRIEADNKLKYVYIIKAMDACIRAGFEQVGFAPHES